MKRPTVSRCLAVGLVGLAMAGGAFADDTGAQLPTGIDLPIVKTTGRYGPYDDFCRREPSECELKGVEVLPYHRQLMQDLRQTSATLNRRIRFSLDQDLYSVEDYWALPETGYGDCEDIALAKRRHLVDLGYASAALRLAFVFSRAESGAHCLLTVETTRGTFLLDSDTDIVQHWRDSPYNFEARERPDGRWDRYDQSLWRYDRSPAMPSMERDPDPPD